MKRFIKLILLGLIIGLGMMGVCSCDRFRPYEDTQDSVLQQKIDEYLPTAMKKMYAFEDPTDAILYKQERISQLQIDSTFCSLPDQTIANICSVLKKQQSTFGISDIVYEYRANARIYNALPDTDDPPIEKLDNIPEFKKFDTLTISPQTNESASNTIPRQ